MIKLFLILILFTVNPSFADTRVIITMADGQSPCGGKCDKKDHEVDAWIAKHIANDSWGKKERWAEYVAQTECLVIEDVLREVNDPNIPYPEPEYEPNTGQCHKDQELCQVPYSHPKISILDHKRCRMPVEYTIEQIDITAEVATKKQKKIDDDASVVAIDAKLLDGSAKIEDIVNLMKILRNL